MRSGVSSFQLSVFFKKAVSGKTKEKMKTIESKILLPMKKNLFKYKGVFKTQVSNSWNFLRK